MSMPENKPINAEDNIAVASFRGLEAYTESDSTIFFGRSKEIKELFDIVKYNTLTLVFGKSGTGKTSLLNAGIFPLLRLENCLPFRIRLMFSEDAPSLLNQVWELVKSQVSDYDFRIENYVEGETLWEFFHREDLWKVVTPVFVFDQFEEIFTLVNKYPGRKEEVEVLLQELSTLIENIVPEKVKKRYLDQHKRIEYDYNKQRVKVIFSFREDFLAEMESVTSRIPSVKHARFRLMPMNGNQADEVITGTWKKIIQPDQTAKIISYLVNDHEDTIQSNVNLVSRYDLLEIEPSLLSQVCASLDMERQKKNQDTISDNFLNEFPKENILSAIYHAAITESIRGNNESLPERAMEKRWQQKEQELKLFIEENLVDDKGFREKYKSREVPTPIEAAINGLQDQFFIREDGVFIELTHDVMASIIQKDRFIRLKREEKNKAIKRALKWTLLIALLGLLLNFGLGLKVKDKSDKIKDQSDTIKVNKDSIRKINDTIVAKTITLERILKKLDSVYIHDTIRLHDTVYITRDSTILSTVDSTKWMEQIEGLNTLNMIYLKNINDLKNELRNKDQQLSKLQADLIAANKLSDDYQDQIADLITQISKLNEQIADHEKKYNQLFTLFPVYKTHVDSVLELKKYCPVDVQYKFDALKNNWESFYIRTMKNL